MFYEDFLLNFTEIQFVHMNLSAFFDEDYAVNKDQFTLAKLFKLERFFKLFNEVIRTCFLRLR